jgi:hypothetical protein
LTNVGTAPLTISNVLATGDYSQTNNCIGALQPNASCNIQVTFTPTVTGSRPGSIVVTDNASDSPQSVALSGTGINPTVSLSPTSLSFGNQLVGTSSNPKSVVLTNTGVGNLLIAGISITGDFTQTNNCPSSLAANSKCTISVKFTPTAQGTRAGTAVITDNAKNSPQQVKPRHRTVLFVRRRHKLPDVHTFDFRQWSGRQCFLVICFAIGTKHWQSVAGSEPVWRQQKYGSPADVFRPGAEHRYGRYECRLRSIADGDGQTELGQCDSAIVCRRAGKFMHVVGQR